MLSAASPIPEQEIDSSTTDSESQTKFVHSNEMPDSSNEKSPFGNTTRLRPQSIDWSNDKAFASNSTNAISNGNQHCLLSFDEIPKWHQDNPYILTHYRQCVASTTHCIRSLLYLHNETVNIYSHLLPAVAFLLLEIFFARWINALHPDALIGDRIVFALYLLSATVCLALSAAFHTMCVYSEQMHDFWLRLDFVGMTVLTVGGFITGVWFMFICGWRERIIYWYVVCFTTSWRPVNGRDLWLMERLRLSR